VLWNDDNGASGGGVSDFFDVPAWQDHAPVPVNDGARRGRGVPDVAGNACSASGYILVHDGAPTPAAMGGTSAAAPLYAGLVALLNARLPCRAGYLNPILYPLASSAVFRDITGHGTNGCPGTPGYPVGPGWDATTGLGSIDGQQLLGALQKHQNAATSPPGLAWPDEDFGNHRPRSFRGTRGPVHPRPGGAIPRATRPAAQARHDVPCSVASAVVASPPAPAMTGAIRSSRSANASGSSGSEPSITHLLMTAAHPPVTKVERSAARSGSSGPLDIRWISCLLTGESSPLSAWFSPKAHGPVMIAR
jgi:hypothetical protein